MTDTRVALIRTILSGDVAAALVLADYLEEQGECRASLLLRRRYKLMQKRMAALEATISRPDATLLTAGTALWEHQVRVALPQLNDVKPCFIRYVARKFVREATGRLTARGGT